MNGLSGREKGFEAEFTRNQELAFRITARRNRLFGLWAADRLGLPKLETEAYAASVVAADFEKPGDDDVLCKVFQDFTSKGVAMSEPQLRAELGRALTEARRQLSTSDEQPGRSSARE